MRNTEEFKQLVLSLCASAGVTGDESAAAKTAIAELSKFMPCRTDKLGSVIGEKEGNGIHFLLDAHLDRIGMVVTSVDDNGFVRVSACGGIDKRVLQASEVIILGREPLFGVITSTPPHLSKSDTKEVKPLDELSIDTGLCGETAKKLIAPGDRVVTSARQRELMNGRIASAALDDRAGVAAILRCVEMLSDVDSKCRLTVLFSVQEETTGGGALTGSFASRADEAIVVDVSFAAAPGISAEKSKPLGSGVMIGIAPSLDSAMSDELINIADAKKISHTVEVMGGRTGTNSEAIAFTGEGTRTALLSIPQRNMHTGVEICDIGDIESTARLMCEYILKRGGEAE